MAQFELAYNKTMRFEGGYADNPVDKGGETYHGISRKAHPEWEGWRVIDYAKEEERLDDPAIHIQLIDQVEKFYFENYWKPVYGNEIQYQEAAEDLFDSAVHMGVKRAVEFCQMTANLLNRNQKLYSNIIVDGKFGPRSLIALTMCIEKNGLKLFKKVFNLYKGAFYIDLMERNESQEIFTGWFERVNLN